MRHANRVMWSCALPAVDGAASARRLPVWDGNIFYPPKRRRVTKDTRRWVTIAQLPEDTQQAFWQKVKANYPDIVEMRRVGGDLFGEFNATFQIPEQRYKQIMETE